MSQDNSNGNQPPHEEEPPQYGVRLPEGQRPAPQQRPDQPSQPYTGGQVPPPAPGQYGQQGSYGQPSPYSQPGPYQQNPYQQPHPQSGGDVSTPPRSIMVAFGLILAAGVLTLVSGIILVTTPTPQLTTMLEQMYASDPMLSEQLAGSGLSVAALADMAKSIGLVIMVIMVAVYALIAFFIRKGSNGARITGTVLAGLSLIGLVNADLLSMLTILLGAGGIVAAWLRPSSQYIAGVKEAKRWRR